jgi:hypothetical protein
MRLGRIGNAGLLFVLAVYATVIGYRNSPRTIAAGATYLAAAFCVGSLFACLFALLHVASKQGRSAQSIWFLERSVRVLLFVACQLQIIALLNMWASMGPSTVIVLIGSYVLAACFIVISDRMIALAELPSQDGGSNPLSYFGLPRSRRLLFWGFILYPEMALALGGIWVFFGKRAYLVFNNPPQMCLLLVALASVGMAAMVFQRYRKSIANELASKIVVLATLLCLGMAGLFQLVLAFSYYVFGLSTCSVICIAISVYWLLRASKNDLALLESAPESAVAGSQGLAN